jgi:hypothetical protein
MRLSLANNPATSVVEVSLTHQVNSFAEESACGIMRLRL